MKNILFRFFFIYFLLTVQPWGWLFGFPGLNLINELYNQLDFAVVSFFNEHWFNVSDPLNANGMGSGDTSFAWAQIYTVLIESLLGCIVWSMLDRKREAYPVMSYLLQTFVRYGVIVMAFSYGVIKIFCMQMPFPNLSQLATPLGDFLPMRLSWMFMGYSQVYQTFAGVSEIVVGLLLIFKPTRTLGAILGFGVFFNVFMMNLGYDIPVKLFSLQLTICCLYLVSLRFKQLYSFFILNKATEIAPESHDLYNKRWKRNVRLALKIAFIGWYILYPGIQDYQRFVDEGEPKEADIPAGVYKIAQHIVNNDTIHSQLSDTLAWKDVIFDRDQAGSVYTCDTLFRHRYHRGYFNYEVNSKKDSISFTKNVDGPVSLFTLHYTKPAKDILWLNGLIGKDTVRLELINTNRHFQLTERQFHWISERNR